MDFYFGRLSGNSARSAFALCEAGIPFTPHPIGTPHSENRQPPYLALNPMGKVPALVDGDVRLWESNAINWYVAEKHPETRLLPSSLAGRTSVQRWLMFQTGHVSPASVTIFRKANPRIRAFWKTDADPKAVEAAEKELGGAGRRRRRFRPQLDAERARLAGADVGAPGLEESDRDGLRRPRRIGSRDGIKKY